MTGVGSLLARSTSSSVRQAQDDPERGRMGQGPEPVEGQAILTEPVLDGFGEGRPSDRPAENVLRCSFQATYCPAMIPCRLAGVML